MQPCYVHAMSESGRETPSGLARAVWHSCALVAALGGLCGCGATQESCAAILTPAVLVTVLDFSENPVCDVRVRIQGVQVDVQNNLTADVCYFSAGEQDGLYTVIVSRGDNELAHQRVPVASGKCGAI